MKPFPACRTAVFRAKRLDLVGQEAIYHFRELRLVHNRIGRSQHHVHRVRDRCDTEEEKHGQRRGDDFFHCEILVLVTVARQFGKSSFDNVAGHPEQARVTLAQFFQQQLLLG